MTIISAFPIVLLMLVGGYCFIKSLKADYQLLNVVQSHSTVVQYSKGTTDWKNRLGTLIDHPDQGEAKEFLKETLRPAFNSLKDELKSKEVDVLLTEKEDHSIALTIKNSEVEDFQYSVRIRRFEVPDYVPENNKTYARAEVFLINGGQDYDVYGYTEEQIAADFISQYEKHFHFLHLNHSEIL